MRFLLDTNVVSEWRRRRPNPGVMRWLAEAEDTQAFISVITIAELRHGVERLAPGARTRQLELWLSQELTARSEGRILTVDVETATRWGGIVARAQTLGRATEPMDAFIAATAERHDLTLVTRNVKDFDFLGIRVINPWRESV